MAWGRTNPNSSGNPNRRRPGRRSRRIIVWVEPAVGFGRARRLRPERYRDPGILAPSFKERLVLGALMIARSDMSRVQPPPDRRGVQMTRYPFPQLVANQDVRIPTAVPVGTLLIYAGTVRVMERGRAAGERVELEVPKHTFIVPHLGRCIVHDLSLVRFA